MSGDAAADPLSRGQLAVLMGSVLIVALCGIAYELIIATVSSYLLGNSVYQFSITIGLFMFAMGLGSYVTKSFQRDLVGTFVLIEIIVALIGGVCSTLLFAVFPFYAWYKPVMYTLIIVIGALVGAEIPLLTRILSDVESLRKSIAHVLSLDYLGALIGSVAFPLLLLPYLGLFRASYAIGLLNIGVVVFTLAVFGRRLPRFRLCLSATVLVMLGLIGGVVYSTGLRDFFENRLFGHTVIFTKQTPYQRIILTRNERSGNLRLYIDGHLQFAERDEYRYHEALVHPVMSLPGPKRRVLILGGGDGLVAREVLKYDEVETIDLVDIDPAITELCSTHARLRKLNGDSLRHAKLHLHHTDAFTFVQDVAEPYDRVIIDLPDPHNEALAKLYSVQFYKMVRRSLGNSGYVVTQSSSPFFTPEVFWCIARTLNAAGMPTFSYRIAVPTFGEWGFALAAADGREVPLRFELDVPVRYVSAEVIKAGGVFGRDQQPDDGPVNTIYQPRLYQMYQRGERR